MTRERPQAHKRLHPFQHVPQTQDGLLSPQDDGYSERFGSRADGGAATLRRWVRSKGPRTPMARLVTAIVALFLTFSLYVRLDALLLSRISLTDVRAIAHAVQVSASPSRDTATNTHTTCYPCGLIQADVQQDPRHGRVRLAAYT